MTSPWLSVLLPTYNGAGFLRAALDSVVAQRDADIECIAVDDGSTDETLDILDEYRGRIPLDVVSRPRAGNWVANTNLALKRAKAGFACLLHQDDTWLPGRLQAIRDARASNPAVDLILHPVWFTDRHGHQLGPWRCPLPEAPVTLDALSVLPRLLVQNFIAIPAPVFRTATARAVGGMDESLWYTADWDFWLKLAAAGRTLYLPDRLACFRVHPEAQTNRRSIDIADYRRQHEAVLERHLPTLRLDRHGREAVRRRAELSIAINVALAGRYHGMPLGMRSLATACWRAGPLGIWRYMQVSRILERVTARLKALKGTDPPARAVRNDAVA